MDKISTMCAKSNMLYFSPIYNIVFPMRILVIEDNIKTADHLCSALKENYYLPDVAYDGQEGLFLAKTNTYDIIILDVMLPHIDGWTLVQKIREINQTIPILFLTARDKLEDRVKGIELGADDYLVKPFAFSELFVRIRSLLRRNQQHFSDIIQVADLKLDTLKHKVTRGDERLNLSAKEFMLLLFLARKTGEVLSRTLIAEQVWDINFDSDTNAIDVAIKRLRDKVDGNFTKKLIHTVRGVGYVLEER